MFEIRRRVAHLPILVMRLGTLELMFRRGVTGFTALVAEIEFQIFAGIGLLFLVSNFLRLGAGFIAPRRILDLRLTRLWLDYTLVTGVIAMGLVLALPELVTVMGVRP